MPRPQDENQPASKNSLEPVSAQEKNGGLPGPVRAKDGPLVPNRSPSINNLPVSVFSPPRLPRTPDAVSLLQAFRYRWLLALSLGLLAGIIASLGTWYWLPKARTLYRAYALIRIAAAPQRVAFPTTIEDKGDFGVYRQTQAELMRSRFVLRAALNYYDKARDELLENNPQAGATLPSLKDDDPVTQKEKREQVVCWLESELKADFLGSSEILSLSLTGDNPEQIRLLINGVKDAYLKEVVEAEQADKRRELEIKTQQYNRLRKDLLAAQRGSPVGATQGAVNSKPEEQQRLMEEYEAYQKQLTQLELDLMRTRLQRKVFETKGTAAAKANVPKELIDSALDRDPLIQRYLQEAAKLEAWIVDYERIAKRPEDVEEYRSQHKLLLEKLAKQREHARPIIQKQIEGQALGAYLETEKKAKTDLEILEEEKKILNEMVESRFSQIKKISASLVPAELRKFEIERLQTITRYVGEEMEAVKVELAAPKRAVALQEAEVPPPKDPNRETKAVGMVGFGAFALVALCVSWWEFRSRRIHTTDEIAQTLNIRLLGALPALPEEVRRQPAGIDSTRHIYSQNVLQESIDGIRTLVLHEADLDSSRVFMVTSAEGQEGKTTLASHLAVSMARAGKKTLLIDGDLIRPGDHKMFDLPLGPGLSELLRGQAKSADVIRPTPAANLWMIPAGHSDRTVVQSLARDGLRKTLSQLKADFDVILIDSSPVLPVAQTLLIGKQSDAVILSVMHDRSRMPPVYAAHHRLASLGIRVLGAVFHKAKSDFYGYGYSGSRDYRYRLAPPAPVKG
jgi:capsular exopolysaccharide synthesis family protein